VKKPSKFVKPIVNIDFAPTILHMAGVRFYDPSGMDGISFYEDICLTEDDPVNVINKIFLSLPVYYFNQFRNKREVFLLLTKD